jgi:uncharacterized membrane protein YhaH (DUF805 family)
MTNAPVDDALWRGYRWPLRASDDDAQPSAAGPAMRGYRWPLRQAVSTPATRRDSFWWEWSIVALLVAVACGLLDLNRVIEIAVGPMNVFGNDLLFVLAAAVAAGEITVTRRRPLLVSRPQPLPFLAMTAYCCLAILMIARDYQPEAAGIANLQAIARDLPFFFTYFIVSAFIGTRRDLLVFTRLVLGIAIAGAAVAVLQSIHGPGELLAGLPFGEALYPPGPQIDVDSYGIFSRVVLPTMGLGVWSLFYCLAMALRRWSLTYVLGTLLFLFMVAVYMARGLYVGIAAATVIFTVIMVVLGRLPIRAVLLAALLACSLPFATSTIGLGDLNTAVFDRTSTAFADYQTQSGTWGSRLDEADWYWQLDPTSMELLFGNGYRGSKSELDLPFLEFGVADLLYRGGIIGVFLFLCSVACLLFLSVKSVRGAYSAVERSAAIGVICSITAQGVFLLSANHFYYKYYVAAISCVVAVVAASKVFDEDMDNAAT